MFLKSHMLTCQKMYLGMWRWLKCKLKLKRNLETSAHPKSPWRDLPAMQPTTVMVQELMLVAIKDLQSIEHQELLGQPRPHRKKRANQLLVKKNKSSSLRRATLTIRQVSRGLQEQQEVKIDKVMTHRIWETRQCPIRRNLVQARTFRKEILKTNPVANKLINK